MRDNQHEPHDADFERALASELKGQRGPDSPCPDADTLAAFWDRSLTPDERRFWEAHCAACLRCQAHLAALARTAAVEGDLAEARRPPRSAWLMDWRWLAPMATAAVVVLAVWGIDRAPPDVGVPTVGDADFAAAPESVQERAESPQATGPERQDVSPAERESFAAEADQPISQDAATTLDQVVLEEPADANTPRDGLRNRASQPSTPSDLAERRLAQQLDARGAAAPISAARAEASVVSDIASPDGSVRWRLQPLGGVERSVDGGSTWTLQLSDAGGPFNAGSAPSASVCWIVGQGGTIFRSVDGGDTWERVTPPRQADLTGVEAVDARSARIDAVDGVSFRTEDGGLTWER